MRRHLKVLLALTCVLAVAGCSPNSPSPQPSTSPPPPPSGIQVDGTVQNAAWQMVPGARVEAVAGAGAGAATTANSVGRFTLIGPFDETTQLRATASGYVDATLPFPAYCATCVNLRFPLNFYLESEIPHADLSGNYQVTVVAASECSTLPDVARERTVAATVAHSSLVNSVNSQYTMTVSGAAVLDFSLGASIGAIGDYMILWLGDHGPGIVEEVDTHTFVMIEGAAEGKLGFGVNEVVLPFSGYVEHCTLSGPIPGPYYACSPPLLVKQSRCQSPNHRLVLRRLD